MIFKPELAQSVMGGRKTQTRRLNDKGLYVGKIVAVCPGRGKTHICKIRITGVRTELLRDISPDDCWAEGVDPYTAPEMCWMKFAAIWDGINKEPGTRWNDNPTVHVYTFEVVKP